MVQRKCSKGKLGFLEQIITILMSGNGSCAHSVHDGFTFVLTDGPQHFAVERLIREFGSRQELADLAVSAYLDRFEKKCHPLVCDRGALEYACRIAEQFPISNESAERLVHDIAQAGWYGRLEGFARKYCQRNPTPEEVALLFESYTHSGCYGTSTDETLMAYADKYMSPKQSAEYAKLLVERNKRLNGDLF